MHKENFNNNQLYGLLPSDCEGMETLTGLALDLRWSWNHAADDLWKQLDADKVGFKPPATSGILLLGHFNSVMVLRHFSSNGSNRCITGR